MKVNSPNFNAHDYGKARPFYPAALFRPVLENIPRGATFLDIGCGAGQSTTSFSRLGTATQGIGVDIDPEMISEALRNHDREGIPIDYKPGSAECLPIPDHSVDLILVGSAFHWFHGKKSKSEMERVLVPGGHLFVFEYQFPKCVNNAELAETVRRRFNLEWRAPVQKPRGTLKELLAPFARDPAWQLINASRPVWEEVLGLESFLNHLFTQSRYRHAEAAHADSAVYRQEIKDFFRPFFSGGTPLFDMKPRTNLWKRIAQKNP